MKKRNAVILTLLSACMLCFCLACGQQEDAPKHETVTLNSANTFYSNGSLLEANIRELTYDGNDASVRIRITNIGDDPVDGVDGRVRFVDKNGELLFEEGLHIAFEEKLYKDGSVSVTVSCSGRDVRNIAAVSVLG